MTFTLRRRLLLMVAVPLCGMLWVAASNTIEKVMLAREMVRLQDLVVVTTRVGALVHELQKERGMSAGFIASQGANFANELPAQRESSEQRRQELVAALARFDAAQFGSDFMALLYQGEQLLAGLAEQRQAVSAGVAVDAVAYYTRTTSALLALPGQVAALSSDRTIAHLAASYAALLQAKERAGIERAALSSVFGTDRFTPPMLLRFLSNAAEQDTWFGIFAQHATAEHQAFAKEKLQGAAVEQVAATKAAAIANMHNATLGMDAKQWFAAATTRINLMKAVEDRLATDLTTAMALLQQQNNRIAWLYSIATVLAGLLVLVLGHFVSRRIMAQIGGEPETAVEVAHAVADGKLDNTISLITGDNSSLLFSMQRMQAQLLERMTAERQVAADCLRVKIALDFSTMPVTISNPAGIVIYLNVAAQTLWREMAVTLHQTQPNLIAVEDLLGQSLAAYFDDVTMKVAYCAELSEPRSFDIAMGGKILCVTAVPIKDVQGSYLGLASQWLDRTQEVQAETELKALLDAAVQGDFSGRIAAEDKQGFFHDMAFGMNQLMGMVVQALTDIARVLNAVARGDLSQTIDAPYAGTLGQLKDDTNATVERLRDVVGKIKLATAAIDMAAKEIAAGNADLSSRTEEQASSLEQTAASMEQINVTVKRNADNAQTAAELASHSTRTAVKGGEMVGRVIATMSGIQNSSQKIADIIGVINSIAFQTNILALNAAVEAARAGAQGRGFAVVATEVRNLAQRSADAAKEIKGLIDESVGKVEGGVQLVHATGSTIAEVVDVFQQLATLVGSIATASREQAMGIEQVSGAVSQMDKVTQQNAALVEEAAAAAESLEDQVQDLSRSVAMFSLNAAGEPSPSAPPASSPSRARHAVPPAPTLVTLRAKSSSPARRLPLPQFAGDEDDAWAEF